MTLRKKDLEAEVRAEPRILPHPKTEGQTGPEPASIRPHTGIDAAPKNEKGGKLNLRLRRADYEALRQDSDRRGISMGAIVRELVHKYLKREGLR